MTDWYVSSAAYAAIPAWQASHAYTVGNIVRPTAAPLIATYPQRCTTAGTSGTTEPSWNNGDNGTTGDGGATWTNVGGQSAYGWGAAAGSVLSMNSSAGYKGITAGNRIFVSSDHAESTTSANYVMGSVGGYGVLQIISVNRAGSVPPVAADALSGAAITVTASNANFDAACNVYYQGFTITAASTLLFNNSGTKSQTFKNCAFVLTAGSTQTIQANNPGARVIWDNTTLQVANAGSGFRNSGYSLDFTWLNTPNAIQGATIPTQLFAPGGTGALMVATLRGVDLSALTTTLLQASSGIQKVLLDSCKIASGLTRYNTAAIANAADDVELVNCYDGTNVLIERRTGAGDLVQDRSVTMQTGATDDYGLFALKLTSSTRSDFLVFPLDTFWLDAENALTGARTASVEIISSASLNNTDIILLLQYLGTSGSPVVTLTPSLASPLTASAALSASSKTWNNPPSTPQAQTISLSFTPAGSGRVRGLVRLGKPSTTVWVNPQITVA